MSRLDNAPQFLHIGLAIEQPNDSQPQEQGQQRFEYILYGLFIHMFRSFTQGSVWSAPPVKKSASPGERSDALGEVTGISVFLQNVLRHLFNKILPLRT